MLKAVVHPANVQDREGAGRVLTGITTCFPHLQQVWADAGYTGAELAHLAHAQGLALHVVRKPRRWVRVPADQEPPPWPKGVQILPRRWVVERTFAWLGRWRRLSKDYEGLPATEEAWIHLAMSMLMLARLAK